MKNAVKWLLLPLCLCLLLASCGTAGSAGGKTAATTEEPMNWSTISPPPEKTAEPTTEPTTEPRPDPTRNPDGTSTYPLDLFAENVKVYGRSRALTGGVACDWTASGIEFRVEAEGAVTVSLVSNAKAYFTLWVDGKRQTERVIAKTGTNDLVLTTFASRGVHTVRLLKQTENLNAYCRLASLTFRGDLLDPPAARDRSIEFYGDSITCGYGNLAPNASVSDPGTADWQDGTQTYAFLAAEALGADWSMISVSGIGVTKGYREVTMPQIWRQGNYRRDASGYDFARVPDLVVVNLGTNDETLSADTSQFQKDVTDLIASIKAQYGQGQKILFVTGMMKSAYRPYILAAIEAAGGTSSGVYEFRPQQSDNAGPGGHPSLAAQKAVAAELASYIQSTLFSTWTKSY